MNGGRSRSGLGPKRKRFERIIEVEIIVVILVRWREVGWGDLTEWRKVHGVVA
jgi:hypothetical protein